MMIEDDAKSGEEKAMNAAIRSAKKSARPVKIGLPQKPTRPKTKNKRQRITAHSGGAFDRDWERKAGKSRG